MKYFIIGMVIAIAIELLTRMGQSDDGVEEVEHEPISISNGTIFKTLVGAGILGWIFKRRKK